MSSRASSARILNNKRETKTAKKCTLGAHSIRVRISMSDVSSAARIFHSEQKHFGVHNREALNKNDIWIHSSSVTLNRENTKEEEAAAECGDTRIEERR